MKAIIDGVRYDPDKAEEIGCWDNGYLSSDFHWEGEVLYRTPENRQYFLAGEGNALSSYATVAGRDRGPGRQTTPLSVDEAFKWAQDHLDVETVEQEFGDKIEDA